MINNIFNPSSVALIGASREAGKLGYDILSNIKNLGFTGDIYPINPKAENEKIMSMKVYKDIFSTPQIPDLVLIVIPSVFVNNAVKQCGEAGIKNIVIISAGFKEVDEKGAKMEEELVEIIKKYNINLIGPNCLGVINTLVDLNASFAEGMPNRGNVALVSQSGAMAVAMIDWAYESGLGFSKIISMGNKAGLTENELLEYLGEDEETKVILMYLESIVDGKKFINIAKKVSLKKPIIIVKSGTSDEGMEAISSHTGSLAGSDEAVTAAFKKAGIIRANTAEELFDFAKIFSYQNLPQGKNIAVITNAGGPGIMATDTIAKTSLELCKISSKTQDQLAEYLPDTASLTNPVDVIGDALSDRYRNSLKILLDDESIHSILIILTPQIMTEIKKVASIIVAMAKDYKNKTVVTSFMGGESVDRGERIFKRYKFPNYDFPERAVFAIEKMHDYKTWVENQKKEVLEDVKISKNKSLDKIFSQDNKKINPKEIKDLLDSYEIDYPKIELAKNKTEAIKIAEEIGFPVVLKISSPQIYHKSDVGGLKINIKNENELIEAFDEIITNCKKVEGAVLEGITVEKMLNAGKEIIIGIKKDPQFGHMIMFGLGGVFVEILKDVVFDITPLTKKDAIKMINSIKAIDILKGARGTFSVDLEHLSEILVKVSYIVKDYPQIKELEINPLIITPDGKFISVDTNCIL